MSHFDLLLQTEFIKAIESKKKSLEAELALYREMLEEKKNEPISNDEDPEVNIHFILKIEDKMLQISKELELYNKMYLDKMNTNTNMLDNELLETSQTKTKPRQRKISQGKSKNTNKYSDETPEMVCYKFDDGTEVCKNTVTPKKVIKRVDSNKSILKGKIKPVEFNSSFTNDTSDISSTNKWTRFN